MLPSKKKTIKSSLPVIGLFLAISLVFSGCSSTPSFLGGSPATYIPHQETIAQEGPSADIPLQPTETESTTQDSSIVQSGSTQPTEPAPPIGPNGWVITSFDPAEIYSILQAAPKFGVSHIQLGGTIVQSIDDIILNPQKREFARDVATQLDEQGINTYVWSRELNLEGTTFRFHWNTPLVSARQAAYRYALQEVPQIDGVVLSFSDALLQPWDATIPSGYPQLGPAERFRFVIDMVKAVVVDEFKKKLILRFDVESVEQKIWLAQALDQYPVESMDVIVPVPILRNWSQSAFQTVENSLARHHNYLEFDMLGEGVASPSMLYCLVDEIHGLYSELMGMNVLGGVGIVQGNGFSILDTPNEANVFALYHTFRGKPILAEQIWDGWVQRRYGIFPTSKEGQIVKTILKDSVDIQRKIYLSNGMLIPVEEGDLPVLPDTLALNLPKDRSGLLQDSYMHLAGKLQNPDEQMLVDLAQESHEVIESNRILKERLSTVIGSLRPEDFDQISRVLTLQDFAARTCMYIKQCYLGHRVWQSTKSETEAIYLEGHLQALESLADRIQIELGEENAAVSAAQIRDFVSDIRSSFPRLLYGEKLRSWNRIYDIHVYQTSAQAVEIRWKTDLPSTTTIFSTFELPIFDLVIPVSDFPLKEHRALLEGLDPKKEYVFRIQCTDNSGKAVNSGFIPFQLEGIPAL
jgi:hypothetical protein